MEPEMTVHLFDSNGDRIASRTDGSDSNLLNPWSACLGHFPWETTMQLTWAALLPRDDRWKPILGENISAELLRAIHVFYPVASFATAIPHGFQDVPQDRLRS